MKLLLPPGIGDCHWVLLKLRAFLAGRNADVWSLAIGKDRRRSAGLLSSVPFVEFGGYHEISHDDIRRALPRGINDDPRPVIDRFMGFDHYMCFNQPLRDGVALEKILPELHIEWNYPLVEGDADRRFGDEFRKNHGDFAIFYFSNFGMHAKWARHFGPGDAANAIRLFRDAHPGVTPVITGMAVDRGYVAEMKVDAVNLIGTTTTLELLALIRRASIIIGFHNGPTLIAPHLGTPCVMLWSRTHFKTPEFRANWVNPDAIGKLYVPLEVEEITPGTVLEAASKIIRTDRHS